MSDVVLLALGAFILLVGLVSEWLEHRSIPPPVLALLAGIGLGPHGLALIDPAATGHRTHVVEIVTRLSLAVGIVSLTLFVPKDFPRRHWRPMLVILAGGMILMTAAGAAIAHLTLGAPLYFAALYGAMMAPTDPVAARPIVEGTMAEQNLPGRIKYGIATEAAANDAAAYPLVFLPFLLLTMPPRGVGYQWFVHTVLYESALAVAAGLALGYATGKLLHAAEVRGLVKEEWRLVSTVAMALIAAGGGHWAQMSELMVVLGAGLAFTQVVGSDERKHEEHGHETANRFLSVPVFGLLGTAIPWDGWREFGWRGVAFATAAVLLRRPPVFLLLSPLVSLFRKPADTLYVGWFGPIGVATLYYGAIMEQRLGKPEVWAVATLVVCVSVIIHGFTATPLTWLYGHKAGGMPEADREKVAEAEEQRESERAREVEEVRARHGTSPAAPGQPAAAARVWVEYRRKEPPGNEDHRRDAGASDGEPHRTGRAPQDPD